MLETIKKYISKQLKYNGIKIEQIYQFNKLNDSFKNELLNGFYFYIKENDLDLFLLTIFFNLTGNYPSTNNLLICNKDTSFEEIQSIINQAINCEFSNLFIIAKCELLNSHTKRKLIHKLKKKTSINIKNILIIIFSNKDSDLHKLILKIQHFNNINLENFKKIKENMDNSHKK